MKYTGILILLLGLTLGGCAAGPSLEELEHQAMLSGDWSAVEKRERLIREREARRGPQCDSGYVAYCERRFGDTRCVCVSNDALGDVFARR